MARLPVGEVERKASKGRSLNRVHLFSTVNMTLIILMFHLEIEKNNILTEVTEFGDKNIILIFPEKKAC